MECPVTKVSFGLPYLIPNKPERRRTVNSIASWKLPFWVSTSIIHMEDRLLSELEGKTALVTGASRGIGAATAIALAKNGVSRVVIHYGGFHEGAVQTQGFVEGAGAQADLIGGDLSTSAGINEFVAEVKKTAGEIDILVNNAGSLVKRAKLLEFTGELFDEVMNLNVKSVWSLCQAVAPYMIWKRRGVIINVSSIAARNGGGPGATIYAAA